jgi:hypothetical protein
MCKSRKFAIGRFDQHKQKNNSSSPPRFITDGRSQRVPENVAIGTQVFQVLAQDGDTGADHQNPIRYSIAGEKRYFDINADTGWVYVTQVLDRESTFVTDSNGAVNLTIEVPILTMKNPIQL